LLIDGFGLGKLTSLMEGEPLLQQCRDVGRVRSGYISWAGHLPTCLESLGVGVPPAMAAH
jgi:hypothetical protein